MNTYDVVINSYFYKKHKMIKKYHLKANNIK